MSKTQAHPYVALLRGINVGGHSVVTMAALRTAVDAVGLDNVSTYIQSGNVLFTTSGSADEAASLLHETIQTLCARPTRAFVLTPAEIERAAVANPFEVHERADEQLCSLLFLDGRPAAVNAEKLMGMAGEEYRLEPDRLSTS